MFPDPLTGLSSHGIDVDPLTVIAGLLGSLLAMTGTWAVSLYRGMGKRITTLEVAVAKCQEQRVDDAREMGSLRAAASAQDAQLAQLRRELSIVRGSYPTVRIKGDARGVIASVSENMKLVFGYDPEHLVGLNAEMLVPEEMRERHRSGLARRAADPNARGGVVEIRETRLRLPSGGSVPVRLALTEKLVAGVKEFIVDVTRLD